MQQQYWNQLSQFKFELCYFAAQFAKYVSINRKIKIGVAVSSSVAIAAWATCASLSFWWGLIIAVGQVVSTVNAILPYQKRIEELSEMRPKLNALYISAEEKWFEVAEGKLSSEEINELSYKQLAEWEKINQMYFREDALPKDDSCESQAEEEKNTYFTNKFGGREK